MYLWDEKTETHWYNHKQKRFIWKVQGKLVDPDIRQHSWTSHLTAFCEPQTTCVCVAGGKMGDHTVSYPCHSPSLLHWHLPSADWLSPVNYEWHTRAITSESAMALRLHSQNLLFSICLLTPVSRRERIQVAYLGSDAHEAVRWWPKITGHKHALNGNIEAIPKKEAWAGHGF